MEQETSDLILFFGRFHPMVLHLPIGFLVIAFLLEILSRRKRFAAYRPAVDFVLIIGAASALITAALGLMLAQAGDYSPDLLSVHQWWGIALTLMAFIAVGLRKFSANNPLLDKIYLSVMSLMMLSMALAGHYGGSLTHGSDYLTQYLPQPFRAIAGLEENNHKTVHITDLPQAQVFGDIIYPILDARCTSCHNESKRKGDLMMHTQEALLAGGENGAIFVPGNPEESEMIKRIHLPETDEDHMPPKGKSQLTEDQIVLLTWWIAQGAPFDKKVAEVQADQKVNDILNTLVDPNANKTEVEKLLASPITPVDEGVLRELRNKGVTVRPLASEIHWLQGNVNPTYRGTGDSLVRVFSAVSEQLTWLNLGGTATTDELLANIAELKHLTRLHLENTPVTDKGLLHLKALPYLEYLNLYGTNVTDEGIQELATLKNLRKLYVWQTDVTTEGITRLREALPSLEVNSGVEGKPAEAVPASGSTADGGKNSFELVKK